MALVVALGWVGLVEAGLLEVYSFWIWMPLALKNPLLLLLWRDAAEMDVISYHLAS